MHATWVKLVAETAVSLALVIGVGDTSGPGTANGTEPTATPEVVLAANAAVAATPLRAGSELDPVTAPLTPPGAGDQPLALTIGDGPLTVLHGQQSFDLVRDPATNRYTATVRGIVLVDARGTDAGWHLQVQVLLPGREDTTTWVQVASMRAFARSLEGLDAGRRRVRPGSWATVAAAAAGNSAGSFAVTIAVTGDGPVSRPSPVHGTLVARAA